MPDARITLRELGPSETGLAFAALSALRPAFSDEPTFVRFVDDVLRPEGYRLVGSFDGDQAAAAAVAGFRVAHSLAWGRFLYVDDVGTVEGLRRRGHGRVLMQWLLAEARRLDCQQLHLDSGVGPERAAAHRLYLNSGLLITAHHFARMVDPDPGASRAS